MTQAWDAVVVGAGPNGLAAAIELARAGLEVLVVEAADRAGGGLRSSAATLPGFLHDDCSAIHPLGALSPFFRALPLAEHGLTWCTFEHSVAHPLDGDEPAVLLGRSLDRTAAGLGADGEAWRALFAPFVARGEALVQDVLAPLHLAPRAPAALARFGWLGMRGATRLAGRFSGERARAVLAGCAAHAILPLERAPSAAVALLFALSAHLADWPCVRGGSQALADALVNLFASLGGTLRTGAPLVDARELPAARVVLFDLSPAPFLRLAGDALPARYTRRLGRFAYGPAVFKVDWALDGPIPWRDPAARSASTVHVGGTLEEIAASERAAWQGEVTDRPALILCQQSAADPTRAPAGQHTGYAYCHVPARCTVDRTAAIESQVERFAPGFRDCILARRTTSPADLERANENHVGGSITGGAATLRQLFTRPTSARRPYATPRPGWFLCSASTPPGGGVHGMCGFHAARAALRHLGVAPAR